MAIIKIREKFILIFFLLAGFFLRYYAAVNVPENHDEYTEDFPVARQISFNLQNLNLPLLDNSTDDASPMAFRYLIKTGWLIFGDSLLGARLPFIFIGTCTILLLYVLTKITFGVKTALIASGLLSFSQYHIAISRLADYNSIYIFFVICSLICFYKAVTTDSNKWFIINGLVVSAGFWFKESMSFLIPIYLIFFSLYPEYRKFIKSRLFWFSNLLIFSLISPLILANIIFSSPRLSYILESATFRISLNAINFYLGELFLSVLKLFPGFSCVIFTNLESEYPLLNLFLGILMLIAVIKFFRTKEMFARLLVVCFLSNFVLFSFISGVNEACKSSYWSLEFPDWSILGFVPGIILSAHLLNDFIERSRKSGIVLFFVLLFVMFIRSYDIARYPLHAFPPVRDLYVRKLLGNYGHSWLEDAGIEETKEIAKDIYQRIFNLPLATSQDKKMAAVKLVQIFSEEGRIKERKLYLDYIEGLEK